MLPALSIPAVRRRSIAVFSTLALMAAALVTGVGPAKAATPTDLFFSEYIEGSSFNKAIEIFNGTGASVSLTGYSLELYSNGASSASQTMSLSGSIADDDVLVLAHPSAGPALLAAADDTNGAVINWNGDDAVVLRKGGSAVDVIGQVGFDPGSQWGTGDASTADNTIRRKASVLAGDTNAGDAFDPAAEWTGFPIDTVDGLGAHEVDDTGPPTDAAPTVTSTVPANNATAVDGTSSITVTFSEPVDAAAGAFSLSCAVSGANALRVSGGPTTYTLDPATDIPDNDRCTVTVESTAVKDQDDVDPPDTMAEDDSFSFHTMLTCDGTYTPAYEIQGEGAATPMSGDWVVTEGVVVGDYEGNTSLRGFYLQDIEGDGGASTSDAVFVFNGGSNQVGVGQLVRVTGFVSEFQGQTQVSTTQAPRVCGTGTVEHTPVTLPVDSPSSLERFEGMLVKFDQTLAVTETFQLGRFGQVTMSSGERLWQPTQIAEPGDDANAVQAENNLDRIIVDDALQTQNPDPLRFGRNGDPLTASNTLRMGDTADDVAGVMTYTWAGNSASGNAYRVRPIGSLGGQVPDFKPTNPRPEEPADVGGSLKVASFNVLNYFNTFGDNCSFGVGGEEAECRGADDAFEFERQADKIVDALVRLDADVVGLIEIENDGYGPDSAIQDLVDRVNAEVGASDAYQVLDVDALTEQTNAAGTDAIKVGFIYRPATVNAIGETAVLNTGAFGDFETEGDQPGEVEIIGRNRPAVTQTFVEKASGGRVTVSVNHLKSKGSGCDNNISPVGPDPDAHDGQGACNLTRTKAAEELAEWLAGNPTKVNESDRLIIGDLNSYAMEDPIAALEDADFVNMIDQEIGPKAYSFVFDGQSGYLDHALASPSLVSQVAGVTEWHINADEPTVLDYNTNFKSNGQVTGFYAPDAFRSSDHDPVVVGLDLVPQGGRPAR